MNDAGITTDLDLDNRCYDDFKDSQPAPKKQNNTDGFEDILNTKKNDTIETNDQEKIYDTGKHDANDYAPVAKVINSNKRNNINDDPPDNEKENYDDDKTETDDTYGKMMNLEDRVYNEAVIVYMLYMTINMMKILGLLMVMMMTPS